jgi:hypothetical protein
MEYTATIEENLNDTMQLLYEDEKESSFVQRKSSLEKGNVFPKSWVKL